MSVKFNPLSGQFDLVEPNEYNVYIFNSSGSQAKNRYNTWSDLVTTLGNVEGAKHVYFEQDETIPSGTHDLNDTTLHGQRFSYATTLQLDITLADGCVLQNIDGFNDGILVTSENDEPCITFSDSKVFRIENGAAVAANNGAEMFKLDGTGGLYIFQLDRGGSILRTTAGGTDYGNYEVVNCADTTATISIVQDDSCFMHQNTFRGTCDNYSNLIQTIGAERASDQEELPTHSNLTITSSNSSRLGEGFLVNDNIDVKTTNYTAKARDNQRTIVMLPTSGNLTVTLPEVTTVDGLSGGIGQKHVILNASASYDITVNTSGSDTVEGGSSYTISGQYRCVTFQATPLGGGAYGYVVVADYNPSTSSVTVDTKENILTSSPTNPTVAIATQSVGGGTTRTVMYYDGSSWYESSINISASGRPVGAMLDSDPKGYHRDYIDSKLITNMMLGNSSREVYSSFRLNTANNPPTLEVYYNDEWNRFVVFKIEDDDKLKHKYKETTYNAWSGDSIEYGINGLPISNQYQTVIGANGTYMKINGGE